MNLTRLKKADDYEVEKWLKEKLDLTDYQVSKMRLEEIIRFSKFKFYKQAKEKQTNILWRVSLLPYTVYYLLLLIGLPFTFLFTGKWGYSRKFYDSFHSVWVRKIRL